MNICNKRVMDSANLFFLADNCHCNANCILLSLFDSEILHASCVWFNVFAYFVLPAFVLSVPTYLLVTKLHISSFVSPYLFFLWSFVVLDFLICKLFSD